MALSSKAYSQQDIQYLQESDTLYINVCTEGVTEGRIRAYASFPYRSYGGWVVIGGEAGEELTLDGSYGIWDGELRIWDGRPGSGGVLLADYSWVGSNTLELTANSGVFVIWFHTDTGDDEQMDFVWRSLHPELCCGERPSNLTVTTAAEADGSCTATLNWQTSAPAGTGYRVSLNGVPVDTTTATTATLGGLAPSMQEEAEVAIVGGEGCGFARTRTLFRTPCTGWTWLPLRETFDDVERDSVPGCWLRAMNFDDEESRPRVVADYYYSRGRSLLVGCGGNDVGGHFSIVATPRMRDGGAWNVSLRLRASHERTRVVVGTADTAVASVALCGFSPMDTIEINTNTEWVERTLRFDSIAAGKRVALMMQQGMQEGTGRRVYVDDFRVEECGVEGLEAYRLMADSVTLAWNTIGNPRCDLTIEQASGSTPVRTLTDVSSPLEVGGLQPGRRYRFTIYPTCGGANGLPVSLTVRTMEALGANDNLCETMQGGLPYGWSTIKSSYSDNAGNGAGDIHAENYLVSPNVAIAGRTVSFDRNTSYGGMTLVVGTMRYPDDTSTFTPVASYYYNDEGFWHSETVRIPDNETDRYVAFKAEGGPDYYCLHVRNVRIGDYPLTNTHAAHVRGTKVELRWDPITDGGCDTVIVEYGPRNFAVGSGLRDTATGSSRMTIGGLQPGTEYDFTAWRPCGGDPCDFRTQVFTAVEDYPLPYCEDFAGMDYVWDNWSGDWRRPQTLYNTPQITDHPWYYGAGRALELGSYGFRDYYYSTALMPDVERDSGSVLSFYADASTPVSYLVIGTWNEYADNIFKAFDTITIGDNRQHYVYPIPDSVADAEGRIALRWWHPIPYSYHRVYIDEIQMSHHSYDSLTPSYVGFDTAAFASTDSVQLTLIGGGDTTELMYPDLRVGHLDTGTLYLMYVRPLTDTNSCVSYAGYFITAAYGGQTGCYTFDELQGNELPGGWFFDDGAGIDNGVLRFKGHAVLPPLGDISGYRLTLKKTGTSPLLTGYTTDSVTYTITDTVAGSEATFYLPPMPTDAQLALFSWDTAEVDMIGISGCRIVRFNEEGGKVFCEVVGGGANYLLTVTDTGDGKEQTFYITETPFVISSLQLDHTYRFSYQCIGDYTDCTPDTIITINDSLTLPYCVNFEIGANGMGIPANWTFFYDPDIVPSLELGWGETPLRIGEWWRENQKVVLPQIDHDGPMSVKMRFHSWYNNSIQIGTVDAAGDTSTFIPIDSNRISGWEEMTIQINALGSRRIAFRANNLVLLDYISISEIPKVKIGLIDWHTLRLTAETEDSIVDYYARYRRDDGRDSVLHVTTNPYYFVEDSFSDIYLTVAQDSNGYICGRENERWQLSALMDLPLCSKDEYWDWQYRGYGDTWDDYYRNRRPHNMRINNDPNNYAYRLLPDFDVDSIQQLTMRFEYNSDRIGEMIEVGVMEDAFDTGSFTVIDTFHYTGDHQRWQNYTVDFSNYPGKGRWIAFRHRSGQCTDCYGQLAVGNYFVTPCPAATASASLVRWNKVEINASAPGFYVGIKNIDNPWDSTFMRIDHVPTTITLWGETTYDFYFRCDSTETTCTPQRLRTGIAPLDIPLCIDFDTTPTVALKGWTLSDTNTIVSNGVLNLTGIAATPDINIDSLQKVGISLWYKPGKVSDRLRVGTMINPNDPQTFWSAAILASQDTSTWQRYLVDFSSAPSNAHYIAFKGNGKIDNIRMDTSVAHGLNVMQVEHDAITLGWSSVGNPATTLTVKQGDSVLHIYYNPTSPLTIDGLNPLDPYTFLFASRINDTGICAMHYADSIKLITPNPGTGCINTTDLHSPSALFTTGTYHNPYAVSGVVDYGYSHPDSRHSICYDTSARDPNTTGLLPMVPEGATSSVRLGNPGTDMEAPQAEAITYSLLVDTASFELILLRYAAVLQDPMHDPGDQPRFRVEVLDSTFSPINPECTSADFIANASLGWNSAPNNVLWKDWTSVGIDLTAYANQQVYVRLTTFDCNEGSHFGYAYFTLECMRKTLETKACGDIDSNTFTAPPGFNYRWYSNQSSSTISTAQSVTFPTADITYYCDLTKIDNESCLYTISAYGGTRYPMASFDTTVTMANCGFDVVFSNTSTVSADGITPIAGETCESAIWDFGNGETSTHYHGQSHYDSAGTYTVTLISKIAGGTCTDTMVFSLTLAFPPHTPRIEGPSTLCIGDNDTLRLYDAHPDSSSSWTANGNIWVLPLSPSSYTMGSNTYTLQTTDDYGCLFDLSHSVTVNPVYRHEDTVHICSPLLPYSYSDTVFLPGTTSAEYHNNILSAAGCDSSYHLWLTVSDASATTFFDTANVSICDNQSYTFFGGTYTDAGTHINVHVDNDGICDSIHTLILDVRPTSAADTMASECDNFIWYGVNYSIDTVVTRTTLNYVNCDSTTSLHLHIRHSADTVIHHYVVENSLPYIWNGISFNADTMGYILTITNSQDCDSNITFNLTVYHNQDTTINRTVCEGQLPLLWNNVAFYPNEIDSATNAITHQITIPTAHGADSLITMVLHIRFNSNATIADTLLQNSLPSYTPPLGLSASYTQNETDGALVTLFDTVAIIPNAVGCDSVVHYSLHIWRNYAVTDSVNRCDNELPYVWQGLTMSTDTVATTTLSTVHATDSVVTLVFTVMPTYEVSDTIWVCPHMPFAYEGVDYGGPIDFDSPHLSVMGCDSLVHVSLQARDSSFRLSPEVSLDDGDWVHYDTTFLACVAPTLSFRDTSTSVSREWTFWQEGYDTLALSDTNTLFSTTVDSLGIFSFQLIAISPEGCHDTIGRDSLLWVFSRPQASFLFSPDHLSIHNPEAQFYNQSFFPSDTLSPFPTLAAPPTYLWLFPKDPGANSYDSAFAVDPYYVWEVNTDTGEYPVQLIAYLTHTITLSPIRSDTLVCTDTATIPVRIVNTYLQFPNTVTPNGDGINDIWRVVNLLEMGEYSMNELWIYDRFGAPVYHVKNISKESDFWDPLDTRSPDGTYYFRFMAKNNFGLVKRNGVIEVVR